MDATRRGFLSIFPAIFGAAKVISSETPKEVVVPEKAAPKIELYQERTCRSCNGTGISGKQASPRTFVRATLCKACNGTGVYHKRIW